MSEKLSMRKLKEILRLKWSLGQSHRAIATSVKVSASTVSDCVRRASQSGLTWPMAQLLDEETLHLKLYGKPARDVGLGHQIDWAAVRKELMRKGVTLHLLWYEYKQHQPSGLSYSRYCACYRQWRDKLDVCLRQTYTAGEKLLVDYAGHTMPIIDRQTGHITDAQVFVGVMGASNRIYTEATHSQAIPDWLGSHVRMFAYYGGVPCMVIPDNLKSGVKSANFYEPDINPSYADLAEHYGVAIVPTRVAKPQDKAKVEQAVLHVERRILAPLRHRQFFSVYELNQAIKPLLDAVNATPFQKLPGSRNAEFEKSDKAALKPLPKTPYRLAQWKKAKVNMDYHIELDKHYYSVPYKYVRQTTDVRYNQQTVEIFIKGKRIAAHQRNFHQGKHTTVHEHMPKSHQAYLEWDAPRILAWAKKKGDSVATLAEAIMKARRHPQQGFRACLGLMRLGKKYGDKRLEAACQRALHIGAYSYKSVESILKSQLDHKPLPEPPPEKKNVMHAHIRGSHYYYQSTRGKRYVNTSNDRKINVTKIAWYGECFKSTITTARYRAIKYRRQANTHDRGRSHSTRKSPFTNSPEKSKA